MSRFVLTHLADAALLRGLDERLTRDRGTTAEVVAFIAEIDARQLFKEAGCESMYAYCLGRLRLSEDSACKRIQAARTAREYPELFGALADGRLNLSSVCMLAPHLTRDNVGELAKAATHRSNAEIRQWLAMRFVPATQASARRQLEVRLPQPAVQQVRFEAPAVEAAFEGVPVASEPPPDNSGPLEYEMRFTMTREDHERFRHAQALLSHAIPAGDAAAIYRRAIEAVIAECEKRKLAATKRPREERAPGRGRKVPAHVRRAVWKRDGGRCTFVSSSGHRCGARKFLEFDHIVPVARGGPSTVDNLRLRCRAHNQDAARRVYGARFMSARRAVAAAAAADGRPWARGP